MEIPPGVRGPNPAAPRCPDRVGLCATCALRVRSRPLALASGASPLHRHPAFDDSPAGRGVGKVKLWVKVWVMQVEGGGQRVRLRADSPAALRWVCDQDLSYRPSLEPRLRRRTTCDGGGGEREGAVAEEVAEVGAMGSWAAAAAAAAAQGARGAVTGATWEVWSSHSGHSAARSVDMRPAGATLA